jgi:ankyrin repeat protein
MEQAPGAGGGERRKNKWVSKKQVVVRSIIIISSSMSHHHHHNNNSSMAKGATATDLRPTEAQLRWAQFHHQRRSVQVRDQVQRLWQTPAFVSDVDGALSEDGNTTVSSSSFNDDPSSSSNSSHSSPSPQQRNHNNNQTTTTTKRHNNNNKKKKNKPPISRGRRALLRVSKRAYEKRREQIAAHGFVCTAGDDVDDENHHAVGQAQQRPRNQLPPASSGNTNKQRRQALQQKFLTSNEPAEDGVEAIFAEEAAWKKKRKRRHARRTVVVSDNDEERVRRFEAAFHAMMMNLSAASRQQQHPEPVISPTGNKRRWTRAVPVAVSIDGRHYDDLKWGVTFRTNSAESPTSGTGSNNPMLMAPLDRGATWMIHLPSKPKQPPRHHASALTILEHPAPEDHPSPLIATTPSAGRMKFNALVSMLQQRTMVKSGPDLMERRVPKMRLRLGKKSQVIEPLATDKRWKKPEIMARRNNNTESTDARDVIVGMRQHDRLPGDHPDHVEFVVDNGQQHLVVMSSSSPQDSESSELRSPKYTSTGHRWTFREPSPETPESATDVFAVLRDVTTTTPKSNMGESVTDSDVYAALLNVQQGDDTPKSTEDGESNVWCQARHVVSSDSNRLFGDTDKDAKYQRLQQAQASNERARNRGSRLLLLPQQQQHGASPGKRSVGSISSSSEASPSNVKGIWRSARNAAGAALTHLSVVSMLNTTNDNNASQTGSAEKKKLSGSQAGIRNTAASSRTHQDSVRSSDSDESQFWNDVRNSGERTEQYSARAVDGHLSSSESNSRDACRRRNLPADLDAQSGGVITPSSDSESSVWRTARNTGDPKSPSSLPSIPERLASVGEATKENRQYPLNDNTVSPQSHHGRKAFKAASDRNMDKAEVAEETDDTTSVSSKGSDVWRMLRNQAKVGGRFLNIIPETKTASVDESTTCDKPADLKSSITQTAARAVDTLGGVLKMLSGKNKDAQDEAKDDEIKAVAAFRKTQDERRVFDTKSTSTSSFGMLPESIRQAVRSPNNGKEDDDHLIFEANPAQNSYEQDENDVQEYISTVNSNMSPNSSRSIDQLSPERARDIHQIVMNNSVLIGDKEAEHTIIDTDDTTSSASIDGYNPRAIASLMLSPALLTKRLHQAIRAIEKRNWVQVAYLLSANPWLAEMVDVTTSQYLLHKLALYGGGACEIDPLTGEIINIQYPPAPDQLNNDLLQMFPASVHKFDNDGNLPLHMAAASGNITMIKLLASRFPEGASVRNEEGMLPLHLLILACASPSVAKNANESPMQMVETLLGYFRGAVAVADNDGNLPLHAAAISLVGEAGVDVVYMLLDEADQQAADPFGPRFAAPSLKVQADADSASVATVETTSPTDSSHNGDDLVHCNAVRNLLGETALMAAINARAGWEIIEAIASGPGGRNAVLLYDSNKNTALHLLLNGETADPAAVLSILKIAPRAVTLRNDEGMLPIEVQYMNQVQ